MPVIRCLGMASSSLIQAIRPTNAQVPSKERQRWQQEERADHHHEDGDRRGDGDAVEEGDPHDEQAEQGDDHRRGGELDRATGGPHGLKRSLARATVRGSRRRGIG